MVFSTSSLLDASVDRRISKGSFATWRASRSTRKNLKRRKRKGSRKQSQGRVRPQPLLSRASRLLPRRKRWVGLRRRRLPQAAIQRPLGRKLRRVPRRNQRGNAEAAELRLPSCYRSRNQDSRRRGALANSSGASYNGFRNAHSEFCPSPSAH